MNGVRDRRLQITAEMAALRFQINVLEDFASMIDEITPTDTGSVT